MTVIFIFESDVIASVIFYPDFGKRRTAGISSDIFDSGFKVVSLFRDMDKEPFLVFFFQVVKETFHNAGMREHIKVFIGIFGADIFLDMLFQLIDQARLKTFMEHFIRKKRM